MIDGMHLKLNTRFCGEEFYPHKNYFAIAALIIVDNCKCIRCANIG
jgi:hypothetical protein